MPLAVTCPACGHITKGLAEHLAGQATVCGRCGEKLRVPELPAAGPMPLALAHEEAGWPWYYWLAARSAELIGGCSVLLAPIAIVVGLAEHWPLPAIAAILFGLLLIFCASCTVLVVVDIGFSLRRPGR